MLDEKPSIRDQLADAHEERFALRRELRQTQEKLADAELRMAEMQNEIDALYRVSRVQPEALGETPDSAPGTGASTAEEASFES